MNNFIKYYKPKPLIILIIVIAGVLFLAKEHWGISVSILSAISGFLILINTYLWKFRPFIWLYEFEDFSGRYEGDLQYQYQDEQGVIQKGVLKHIKIINQSGSRITVSSFTIKKDGTKSSLSVNKGMHLEKTEDEAHYRLLFNYLNGGSIKQKFSPHYGTDELKFVKKADGTKLLFGQYYTNREPQTKGVYSNLKWVSDDLTHEF